MYMKWPPFGTMSMLCLDHARTMFGLASLPDKLEHWNFEEWVNMVQGIYAWNVSFLGPWQGHDFAMLRPHVA